MWTAIARLVAQLAAIRWLFKLGGLALLLPIAAILKVIGVPLMIVLSIVALPVMILLFLFGLPIFLVLAVGGIIMALFSFVLMIGVAALKIFIFVVLPIWALAWIVRNVWGWTFGRGSDESPPPATSDPIVDPLD